MNQCDVFGRLSVYRKRDTFVSTAAVSVLKYLTETDDQYLTHGFKHVPAQITSHSNTDRSDIHYNRYDKCVKCK